MTSIITYSNGKEEWQLKDFITSALHSKFGNFKDTIYVLNDGISDELKQYATNANRCKYRLP